jgi:hypothetical protein
MHRQIRTIQSIAKIMIPLPRGPGFRRDLLLIDQFTPQNADILGSFDADPYPVSGDLQNVDCDAQIREHNPLIFFTR